MDLSRFFLALFSFEFVFILFLFSGQYKADPRFDWIPYDATVFWGLVNVAQSILLVVKPGFKINQAGLPVVFFGVLFAIYTIASLSWGEGVNYATYKAAYISTIGAWCLCAGALIISSTTIRLVRFFRILVLFSAWIAIECVLFYSQNARFGNVVQVHAMAEEGAYIGLGRVVCGGGLVCAVMWLFGCLPGWGLWRSRLLTLVVLSFFVGSAAIAGARGPVAAAVLAVAFVCFALSQGKSEITLRKKFLRVGVVLLVCWMLAYGIQILIGDLPLVIRRFLAFADASEYFDASGASYSRIELFIEAFWAWIERPIFGHGIGSFPVIWANLDERLFPHNLVLELLCELGLIGLLLFIALPLSALAVRGRGLGASDIRLKTVVIALAAYTFANSMTSGDLPDNRVIFLAIGLLAFRQSTDLRRPPKKSILKNRRQSSSFPARLRCLSSSHTRVGV